MLSYNIITKYFSFLDATFVILGMPYYRVVIWTKRRKAPYMGIRLIGEPNINAVYNQIHAKAVETYRKDLIDVEVQMLSKLCRAVKELNKPAPILN